MRKLFLALIFISATFFLGASCNKSDSDSSTSTPVTSTPMATNQITIDNFAFIPNAIIVTPGTTVTWTNQDSTTHTVTGENIKLNSANLAPGDKFDFTFSEAGTFSYHCSIHPNMIGQVEVK